MVRQTQSGGDDSKNVQIAHVDGLTVNNLTIDGPSEADVEATVKRLVEAEIGAAFDELSDIARETADSRAMELLELLVPALLAQNSEGINAAHDPDFQGALITAQRAYARSGKSELRDLLVDVLVDRSSYEDGGFIQIVLNEALVVAPKLTAEQLAGLTAIFFFGRVNHEGLKTVAEIAASFTKHIGPFVSSLPTGSAWFEHLQYTGCLQSAGLGTRLPAPSVVSRKYPGLFCTGIEQHEIDDLLGQFPAILPLIIPCLNHDTRQQFRAIDEESLRKACLGVGLEKSGTDIIVASQARSLMDENSAMAVITAEWSEFGCFADWWKDLNGFTMTSVGITIAHANLTRVTGARADLSIWIN